MKRKKEEQKREAQFPIRTLLKSVAFLEMTLAATEVYKRETLGFLLGYRTEEEVIIEHAIPYQTARRGYTWAGISKNRIRRIQEIARRFGTGLFLLGDFHSHVQLGKSKGIAELSAMDEADIVAGMTYIVLSLNECKDCCPWIKTKEKTITGSLGEFMIEIAAYYAVTNKKYQKIEVVAPWATGIPGREELD